jgi:hypothetical protein
MNHGELLQRIASTLKRDVGPAIEAEYPKTQAFMAAVVLQKLGRQLDLEGAHRSADAADLSALREDLRGLLGGGEMPASVTRAIETLARTRDAAALCALIETLYASRGELGAARFDALLGRVRETLRASIDRRMEYAA